MSFILKKKTSMPTPDADKAAFYVDTNDDLVIKLEDGSTRVFSNQITTAPVDFSLVFSGANQANGIVRLAKWRRQGAYLLMDFHLAIDTAALGSGSVFFIDLPIVNSVQLKMDTALMGGGTSVTNEGRAHFGYATRFRGGVGWTVCSAVSFDPVGSDFYRIKFEEAGGAVLDSTLTFASGQLGALKADSLRIPILGWS
jgi:hypothetical protein